MPGGRRILPPAARHGLRGAPGVLGAAGTMRYRVVETCEAWAVDTNIRLDISYAEGADVAITWSFAGVESKAGLAYRFRMRHSRGGQAVDRLRALGWQGMYGKRAGKRLAVCFGETIRLAP